MGEETLLIVGNGFDLSMGFKTSYGDFMKSSGKRPKTDLVI